MTSAGATRDVVVQVALACAFTTTAVGQSGLVAPLIVKLTEPLGVFDGIVIVGTTVAVICTD
jgi:hypothetical protein